MRFNGDLLDTSRGLLTAPDDLYAALNAHGLYNSRCFVLRLSPEVHRRISNATLDLRSGTSPNWQAVQAMSTYIHETLHWWQHIGTTTGLLLSLTYPVQALANYNHLLRVLKEVGPKKSLRELSNLMPSPGGLETAAGVTTAVVN